MTTPAASEERSLAERCTRALPLLLFVVTFAIDSPVAWFDFLNYDDPTYVTQNEYVRRGLDGEGVAWAFASFDDANWLPVTWLSHMLDSELFGMRPGPRHLVNAGLHATSAALLHAFLAAATGAPMRSFFVAALFALHPLNVQPVAWISQRKDMLAGLFFMLGLLAYGRYARCPSRRRYALVVAVYAIGLGSKPVLVSFPCVLLLLDYWPLRRWPSDAHRGVVRLVVEKLPLAGLALVSSAVTLLAQSRGGAVASVDAIALPLRLANAAVAYCTYVARVLWPAGLAIHHPYPRDLLDSGPSLALVAGCVVMLAGATGFALARGRRSPYLAVGWLWYLVVLAPMAGFVQVGRAGWADRYAYLPGIGLFLLAVWGVHGLAAGRRKERFAVGLGIAAVAASAVGTARELPHWRDDRTVFERALEVTQDNAVAHDQLAQVSLAAEDLDQAVAHWREAVRLAPDLWKYRSNLASALERSGRLPEALEVYRALLQQEPGHGTLHYNYGVALARSGRVAAATEQYRTALAAEPSLWQARLGLADSLSLAGDPARALPHYQQLAETHPDEFGVQLGLANALAEGRRFVDAVPAYRRALASRPRDVVALSGLGSALLELGRIGESVEVLEAAVATAPKLTFPRYNLARALELAGRREAAIAQLVALLERTPDDAEARRWLARLQREP